MTKYKRWVKVILILVILAMLIPVQCGLDDGGTVIYDAVLWQLEKQHQMWREGDVRGYNIGTIFSVLSFEIYNDVVFVPKEK